LPAYLSRKEFGSSRASTVFHHEVSKFHEILRVR
jgi:hypothetical protein